MKDTLSEAFNNPTIDPEVDLEYRLSKLPKDIQDKYRSFSENQEKQTVIFNQKLEKDRPNELAIVQREELSKLTAPALEPQWAKRTRVDIEKEAKLKAEKRINDNENLRKERLSKRHFNDRKSFIENAERQQRKISKSFNQRGHEKGLVKDQEKGGRNR